MSTGEIIYDNWTDDLNCSELETRIVQLQPSELLVSQSLSDHTKRIVKSLLSHYAGTGLHKIRTEQIKSEYFQLEYAQEVLRKLLHDDDAGLAKFNELPEAVQICLGVLAHYLHDFKLDPILTLANNVHPFCSKKRMRMNGTTLTNLEILCNQTNGGVKGSLYWVLNFTCTPFGSRLLKKWTSQPLIEAMCVPLLYTHNTSDIQQRLEAVEELMNESCLKELISVMKTLPDLGKKCLRI